MSLGLGILLSTILIILVWQIDKRSAWRKVALWLVAVVVLAGATKLESTVRYLGIACLGTRARRRSKKPKLGFLQDF